MVFLVFFIGMRCGRFTNSSSTDSYEDWQAAHVFLLTPMDKSILVTGATGYIASRLIPRLLESGYRVRCLVRDPLRLKGELVRQVDIVQRRTIPSTLDPALEGVHTGIINPNMTQDAVYNARIGWCEELSPPRAEAGIQTFLSWRTRRPEQYMLRICVAYRDRHELRKGTRVTEVARRTRIRVFI